MTERSERVPVDLDRLADHVAGALEGTPRAAEVEHLVATDPAWAAAAAALRDADERVRADLAALEAPPTPVDVAARLDAALAAERPQTAPAAERPQMAPAAERPDSVPVRPGEADRGSTRPGGRRATSGSTGPAPGRRARRRRALAWAGAAAVVFALAAGGVTAATMGHQRSTSSASTASGAISGPARDSAKAPQAAAPEAAGRLALPPVARASGTDYRADTLARAAAVQLTAGDSAGPAPVALERLADPAALAACTSALTVRYGGTVRTVDFARFNGVPAVIVVLDGQPVRVVAAGARCGLAGTDEIYATTA